MQGVDTEDIRRIIACFCADARLVASRDAPTLQKYFDMLTALFDQVGLRTKTTKTEFMIFLPGCIRTPLTQDAYKDRMSDLQKAERKGRKVNCPARNKPFAVGSLKGHNASQHDQYQCFLVPEPRQEEGREPQR